MNILNDIFFGDRSCMQEETVQNKFIIIKEENDTNYGHNDLIIKGSVVFPIKQNSNEYNKNLNEYNKNSNEYNKNSNEYNKNSNEYNKNSNEYNKNSNEYYQISNENQNNNDNIFDIEKEINSKQINIVSNQKDYFELYRYGINKLNKPNDNIAPTFSISLFMPSSKFTSLDLKDWSSWMSRYFINHLKQIILINYYFPEANYRTYLDWYMLNAFEKISGNDDKLIFTKIVSGFEHNDYEDMDIKYINNMLKQYYNIIKKYEDYNFENGLCRILFYYDIACKIYYKNENIEIRDKTGDFFVYKFKQPFIENIGQPNECHITDGYIGQMIRYISVAQKTYLWNNINITRPKHLVWRDAHTNSLGRNDYEWINKLYLINKNKNDKLFFLPSSNDYVAPWHDLVKCNVNKQKVMRSSIAGIVQFINFTNDDNFLQFDIYKQTIGVAFLLDNNNELPLKKYRPDFNHGGIFRSEYEYGIEEYVFGSFFRVDYFIKNSIFYNNHFTNNIFNNFDGSYIISNVEYLLFKFLVENKIIAEKTNINIKNFINEIEKLRNNKNFKNDNIIRLLLSIYPTKYFYNDFIFSLNNDTHNNVLINKTINFIEYKNKIDDKIKNINLDLESLNTININCKTSVLNNALEWCTIPYIDKSIINVECNPDDYISGFYFDKQPSIDIGFLRSPDDLEHVINVLKRNNLKLKLNKSNYKLQEENDKLKKAILRNVNVNVNNGYIISPLQKIILKFGNISTNFDITEGEIIAQNVSSLSLNIFESSYVWIPLIWKALNYAGYDVPPEYFINLKLKNENDYKTFNNNVKKLAIIPGWPEYALDILINTDNKFNNDDYFMSTVVENISNIYINKNHGNMSSYKMEEYKKKYLKYKKKYLNLVRMMR